jgi:hypothetical protein
MFATQIVDYETAKLLSKNKRANVAVFSARSGDFWNFQDHDKYGAVGLDAEFIFIALLLVPNHD